MSNKKSTEIVWTFRVKLANSLSDCIRVIEIKSGSSFFELHEAIQDAVGFDNDHLFEFYIGRHPGQRAYLVAGEPNWDTFNPVKAYQGIRLSEIWPLPTGMKLFYLFDFGDNWVFEISKTRHKDKTVQPGVGYPRVIEAKGKNPEQYPDWDE